MLTETDVIPFGLLEANADELLDVLGSPTLIHLEGKIRHPIFISTLLHGNETSGFYALQKLLNKYNGATLPRSLSIFIGNVKAASTKQRRLNTQADYNRVWPGTDQDASDETTMMLNVTNIMREKSPFMSIDIHNNTGQNPHYACINSLNPTGMPIAGLFSNNIVYFTSPKGVQSAAFSEFCPAIVLECGQSSEIDGINHSLRFLESILELHELPIGKTDHINLFHSVARLTIPETFSFGASNNVDICLLKHLENKNFHELKAGEEFAKIGHSSHANLMVRNEDNTDVTDDYLEIVNNSIILKKDVTLSMYTTDEQAVRQDCLCYFMDKIYMVDS